jgi:hypothetical protein
MEIEINENSKNFKEILRDLSFFLTNLRNSLNDDRNFDGNLFINKLSELEEFSVKIKQNMPKLENIKFAECNLFEKNEILRDQIKNLKDYQNNIATKQSKKIINLFLFYFCFHR